MKDWIAVQSADDKIKRIKEILENRETYSRYTKKLKLKEVMCID